MTMTLNEGWVEIPEVFRKEDGLKQGQACSVERLGRGEYRLKVQSTEGGGQSDILDWLLACPEKDWWTDQVAKEMTSLKGPTLFAE
jgi:hypothetical protein